jgi:hypothetical protein
VNLLDEVVDEAHIRACVAVLPAQVLEKSGQGTDVSGIDVIPMTAVPEVPENLELSMPLLIIFC